MYSWYPKRLYPRIPNPENHLDVDELIPEIPKASGQRKYKPELRPTFHRIDAIEDIINEYVPPPDPAVLKQLITQQSVPYEKKFWIKEENSEHPLKCSCCSNINDQSVRFRSQDQLSNIQDSIHIHKSGNKTDDFVKAYLTDGRESRLPGILVTERALGRNHIHSDGQIHYHNPSSPARTYRSHLHGDLVNSELYEAEDRYQKAETRLQTFLNRSSSPQSVGRVPFPSARLSVRFAKVPMRYVYTPPYDYYD